MTKSVFLRDGRLFLPGFFFSRGQKKRSRLRRKRPDLSSRHSQDAGLERYAIAGQEADWSEALVGGKGPKSGLLSVKRKARGDAEETPAKEKKDRKEKKAASAGKKSKSGGKKKR